MPNIKWNPQVKLILSDVDQTLADDFVPASDELIVELEKILESDVVLFMLTGGPLVRVKKRITDKIKPKLRKQILVAHCLGAEVWGFSQSGEVISEPYYSKYSHTMDEWQKLLWRKVVAQIVNEFELVTYPVMTKEAFNKVSKGNPRAVMLEDRGPQITLEVVNGYKLNFDQAIELKNSGIDLGDTTDLRHAIKKRAEVLLSDLSLPVEAKYGGVFALDFVLEGVSKTLAIKYVLEDHHILENIGLTKEIVHEPNAIEIWGDRFSKIHGGDWQMCVAVSPKVRAIDFRKDENPDNYPDGYNIQIWDGKKELEEGLLEYLRQRTDLRRISQF